MKKLTIALNIIRIAIIICLMACFVRFATTKTILNHSFYIVNGNSMYPTLKNDDFLIASNVTDVEVGDVICFEQNNKLIVHRVIYRNENEIITKGDFNEFQDEKISISQVKGKVVYKSTGIGFIYKNLHIVIFACCVLAVFKLIKIKNE